MKKLLLLFSSALVVLSAQAQTVIDQGALVAYVNSDRTQILSVRPDSAPKVLLQSTADIKASHLAVLASTRNGKSLLVAGVFHFLNRNDDSPDSMQAFLRLDSPYAFSGRVSIDKKTLGGKKVLRQISYTLEDPTFIDVRKPLPIGTLSPNEQDWYGHWAKNGAAPNSFEFYHGKFDGSGTVDVGTLPDDNSGLPTNEYHMTNICADEQGRMICVVMDRLTQEEDLLRARLWRWTPSTGSAPQLSDMNSIKTLRSNWHMDSSFVCLLRILPGQTTEPYMAEIGLMPNDVGNIIFYDFRYDGGSISLTSNGREIPRNVLPDSLFFFTGITGNPNGPGDDKETQSTNMRHVNGGDMMFSQTGDSVVFITSNALTPLGAADWYASPERSGVWIYNIAEQWPKAKLVYNNPAKMERQPIFMGYIPKIAPPPPQGTITFSIDTLQFDSVEVAKSKSLTVTMSNPSPNTVNNVVLGLPTNDAFVVTSSVPDSLTAGQAVTVTVTFNPSVVGEVIASIKATYANSPDSSKTLYLRGIGKQKPGAVDGEELSIFDVRVHPNPMTTTTKIEIQFDSREPLSVSLVDVLGREYQLNALPDRFLRIGAGDQVEFQLDKSVSGLVPGSYTLLVRNGVRLLSRQIVVAGN